MPRDEIPKARIEQARQLYLSGKTLRQVHDLTGISMRRLARASSEEGWVEQRDWKQNAQSLPGLIQAVEQRVGFLARNYRERFLLIESNLGLLAERLADDLATLDLDALNPAQKVAVLRLAMDALTRIRHDRESREEQPYSPPNIILRGDAETQNLVDENTRLATELRDTREEVDLLCDQLCRGLQIEQIVRREVYRAVYARDQDPDEPAPEEGADRASGDSPGGSDAPPAPAAPKFMKNEGDIEDQDAADSSAAG